MKKSEAILALGALAQETRLDIFRLLVRAASWDEGEGGLPAGEIASRLSLPAPTLSFHLKEMMRASLLTRERRGRSIIYHAQIPALQGLANFLLDDCCRGFDPDKEEPIP